MLKIASGAALAALLVWLGASLQGEPEVVTRTVIHERLIPAPPSPSAEPELSAPLDAPFRQGTIDTPSRPAPVTLAEVAPKPVRSPAVYAMIARRQCSGIGDPDDMIRSIVAMESTISAERMTSIRSLADRCSQLSADAAPGDFARLGREIDR